MKRKIYFILLAFLLFSCQEGLAPLEKATIKGKITFIGNLPSDSLIKDLRVVAFNNYPPKDIVSEVLTGNAIFTESLLPIKNNECYYFIEIDKFPKAIEYLVVARQYGTLFEWDVVGVYSNDTVNYTPKTIVLTKPTTVNIDFVVDFNKKLPQPF